VKFERVGLCGISKCMGVCVGTNLINISIIVIF